MANAFLNTQWVSLKVLRLLLNKLIVAEYFNRSWQKDFQQEFAPGSQITVKFPQRFTVSNGMGYQPQGINRLQTPVNLDQWMQVSFEWDDYEAAVKLERSEEELEEQYFEPAAAALAQDCDSRCAKWAYQNASMLTGALGTDPTSVTTYYTARQRLEENAAGVLGKRCMLISSSMMTSLGSNITTIFHPADEITKAWKEGVIGELGASMFYESQSLYSHTAGTWAAAVTVNGAGQSGTAITITATAGDTFKVGDKISFAGVNLVNPMTRRIPGKAYNKVFTVTQALTAVGGGVDVLQILPPIYGPGSQYQNVDALPANAAALTLWPGTASPNGKVGTVGLNLTRQAFAIVGAKLYVPTAVEKAGAAQDPDTGLSIRKVKAWDPVRSVQVNRMDSLFGLGNLYQDNGAVAVVGA
jgi:P22 coat protein - gene protein 5